MIVQIVHLIVSPSAFLNSLSHIFINIDCSLPDMHSIFHNDFGVQQNKLLLIIMRVRAIHKLKILLYAINIYLQLYKWIGHISHPALGAGRMLYHGVVMVSSTAVADGVAAMAFRNGLKRIMRGPSA